MRRVALKKLVFSTILEQAANVLQDGGVVMYPTDTVYGLGADATDTKAVAKVRTIKGRSGEKPILAMVADMTMLEEYAEVTPLARDLAQQFLPGPLTLVLEARGTKLNAVSSLDGTLGFRMPKNSFCIELVRKFGKPVTSTSVNLSGMEQSRTPDGMLEQLGDLAHNIDVLIDAGELQENQPSTIVDARGENMLVVREGALLGSTLRSFL